MQILILGRNGQVGYELARILAPRFDLTAVGRQECDLSNPQAIRELIRRARPRIILNAAAYTAVDQAESEPEMCFAINSAAPGVLAEEAARLDAILVHYSTDYVFNGGKGEPYVESDAISPLNVYGASKAAGEAAVAQAGGRYIILRTSWVYGAHGRNFLQTIVRLAGARTELRIVDDQVGAPTSAPAIAQATSRLVEQYTRSESAFAGGLFHMTAGGTTSWCGFAEQILNTAIVSRPPRLIPIATAEYPTPARRPLYSVLSNDLFARTFGFRLPPWQQQLAEFASTTAKVGHERL